MCGILFSTKYKNDNSQSIDDIIYYLKSRGPDKTSVMHKDG
jgi:asparagine synthetase B (glutamine-hydrolysing)